LWDCCCVSWLWLLKVCVSLTSFDQCGCSHVLLWCGGVALCFDRFTVSKLVFALSAARAVQAPKGWHLLHSALAVEVVLIVKHCNQYAL
jgi:hypothetical protein